MSRYWLVGPRSSLGLVEVDHAPVDSGSTASSGSGRRLGFRPRLRVEQCNSSLPSRPPWATGCVGATWFRAVETTVRVAVPGLSSPVVRAGHGLSGRRHDRRAGGRLDRRRVGPGGEGNHPFAQLPLACTVASQAVCAIAVFLAREHTYAPHGSKYIMFMHNGTRAVTFYLSMC